jgi:hypothetical protein
MKKHVYLIFCIFMVIIFSCEPDDKYSCDSSSPNRTGAVCKDGSTSNSVGSGTCSGHGGVKYWLCN